VALLIFKISVAEHLGQAGSIPVRLRQFIIEESCLLIRAVPFRPQTPTSVFASRRSASGEVAWVPQRGGRWSGYGTAT
jgi:hypothetical protein